MHTSPASLAASQAALRSLGFIQLSATCFDSPMSDEHDMPIVQADLYECSSGYWCVSLEGDYCAPIVWNGPKAAWDKSDTLAEFIAWLDANNVGWRASSVGHLS